jgi:pyruvate,orthophosphate dikinase
VNVQAMVFGNMGEDCATGVCFTRDPSTGENIFYGEYLINAQGEDVVAGIRTPQPMRRGARQARRAQHGEGYARRLRRARARAGNAGAALPRHADIEFTVQQNKLYMLQRVTASAPRPPASRSPWTWPPRA